MIKVYGTSTCPDCIRIKDTVESRQDMEYIDICSNVRSLKEFIRIRDNSKIFDECKKKGSIGIPCFVFDDGRISLDPKDAGIIIDDDNPVFCSIEDHKSGKRGC